MIKLWPWVGGSLLAGIFGLIVYFYFRVPLLINPREVIARMGTGTLARSSLETMAVMLPVVFGLVFFLLVVMIVLIFVALANEKKYLRLIEKNEEGP